MKTPRNILFALLLLSSAAGVASASTSVAAGIHIGPSGHTSVDLGFFYDNLAPYGNWVQRPSYGWVWTPTAVSTSWRPYENGHWAWTDEGWVWVTDEPYGWATYHYGRWYDDPEIGWAWVPGDEWGSSWVSWQAGADYVGWAPLPPGVNVSVGLGGGYGGYAYGIAPENYVFVPDRYFLAPSVATYVVPTARVRGFWGQTRNFANYRFAGGRAFNQGLPVDQVQRFVGRRVPRYQVADLGGNDFRRFRGGARIQGERLAIFRPQVQKAARVAPPIQRAAARRAVVSAAQFKAAHPQRVAFAQRQQTLASQSRQQVRQQQRAEMRGGAPALNQRGKALQQRQAQSLRQQEKLQQRQTRVDQRQARVDNQRVRMDRQQRQAQSFRQQQKVQQRQARIDQRQTRVDRQRVQIDRAQQRQAQAARQQQKAAAQQQRQARAERQQFQSARQQQRAQQAQQRQAMQQQRAAQRQGGGRGQGQGGNGGHHGHGRPPGR